MIIINCATIEKQDILIKITRYNIYFWSLRHILIVSHILLNESYWLHIGLLFTTWYVSVVVWSVSEVNINKRFPPRTDEVIWLLIGYIGVYVWVCVFCKVWECSHVSSLHRQHVSPHITCCMCLTWEAKWQKWKQNPHGTAWKLKQKTVVDIIGTTKYY